MPSLSGAECKSSRKVLTEAMKRAPKSHGKLPAKAPRNETAEKISMLLTLALREYEADRPAEVERLCLRILALDVRHADGLYLLGMAAYKTQRYELSERMIRRAIAVNGQQPFYYSNLGNALKVLNRLDEAQACFERAIKIKRDHFEAWYNLGNTFLVQKKYDQAAEAFKKAIAIKPDYPDALCNLGNVYRKQDKLVEAIDCFRRALVLAPTHADLHCNLGDSLHVQGKVDEAIVSYKRTLDFNPNHHKACNCLCNAYFDRGELTESMAWCERALAIDPDYADAKMNLCLLQLLLGDYVNGWRNYEVRWKVYTARTAPKPLWLGAPLNGARILLHAEQGLGDSLQFMRYVPLVQAAGGQVILDVPAKLRRIAAQLPGLVALVNTGDPVPCFDFHCPLMSLPLALGTTLENIPAHVPYLFAPMDALEAAHKLSWPAAKLKIGIAWTGNSSHPKNRYRSVPLELLETVFDIDGAQFYSLQMGPAEKELAARKLPVTDLAPVTGDMADTAAQMAYLDLVITIDTSMAHLAGALGKSVWVLLSYAPDWRWLMDREDSPWYPTARLFRQPTQGDWNSVIARVRKELVELVKRTRQAQSIPVQSALADVAPHRPDQIGAAQQQTVQLSI
jgi:tetratricopeptide (TPR) repeat protein